MGNALWHLCTCYGCFICGLPVKGNVLLWYTRDPALTASNQDSEPLSELSHDAVLYWLLIFDLFPSDVHAGRKHVAVTDYLTSNKNYAKTIHVEK